jgi:hypothetical protein
MLRSYDQLGLRRAVLMVGLMFAFYHLRLAGLLAILPIALALGYLARSSGSIFPAMAAHFITNLISSVLLFAAGSSNRGSLATLPASELAIAAFGLLIVAGFGLLLAVGGLWMLNRFYPKGVSEQPELTQPVSSGKDWLKWLPLVCAALVFIAAAVFEFLAMRSPEVSARRAPVFDQAPWQAAIQETYRIQNRIGQEVGPAVCSLTPLGEKVTLECRIQHQAYDVTSGSSHYLSSAFTAHNVFTWQG